MGLEEVIGEELQNNPEPAEAGEGTLEQSEPEQTQTTEEVEEAPVAEDPLAGLTEAQREAVYKHVQSRFTPAQQARTEEARLAKEEARLAKEEARLEREQRLAHERRLAEIQAPAAPKTPEDPEPDPVLEQQAWQEWKFNRMLNQKLAAQVTPMAEKLKRLEAEERKRAVDAEWNGLAAEFPDLNKQGSDIERAFSAFMSSRDPDDQRTMKAYRDGAIPLKHLFRAAIGPLAAASAEQKVKDDLQRKVNAQVAGRASGTPKPKKYASTEEAIMESIREAEKG